MEGISGVPNTRNVSRSTIRCVIRNELHKLLSSAKGGHTRSQILGIDLGPPSGVSLGT